MEAWRHIWDHVGRAHWMRFAPVVLVFGLVVLTCGTGLVTGLDHRLAELRFEALRRPASDTLVVVEIDAASLSQLDQWPWTRGIYADVVRQVDDAGARLIAFDVDFSARSDEAGDALLAAAIGRASGRVILPTFKQVASSQDPTRVIEATPNAQFSEHAILASVNVEPSPDGVVRRARYGFRDADGYRASVAGALSDVEYGRDDSFDIDFGIDVDSITRVSFVDVYEGRFDPAVFQGRNVLIGATALELGDEFVTPRYKLISGVLVHALAYESLAQGRALHEISPLITLALAGGVVLAMCRRWRRWSWFRLGGGHTVIFSGLIVGPLALQAAAPVSLDVAPAFVAQALCLLCAMSRELRERAAEILSQRAQSARHLALVALTIQDSHDGVVVTDANGRIEICNPQAARYFTNDAQDLTGRLLTDVAPKLKPYATVAAELATRRPVAPDGPLRYHYIGAAKRGARAIEVTASRAALGVGEGAGEILIYALHDVTARVKFERAEAAAKRAAEEASAGKTRFISTMSHELRTPLNAVIGFSDSIRKERHGAPEKAMELEVVPTKIGRAHV